MNNIGLSFVILSALALLTLPRRWAPLPLLAATCYMTMDQKIELGPFSFTVLRILVAVGAARIFMRGEGLAGRTNRLDALVVAWGIWLCASSLGYEDSSAAVVTRLGAVYDCWGIYFLLRSFCMSLDDVVLLCRTAGLILIPVAAEMMYEQVTFHNLFSILGGVPDTPHLRDGRIRAFGPFAHPILAGSVGAVTLPLMLGVWRYSRLSSVIGIAVCLAMVLGSASSGPAMSAAVGVLAICMWRFREYMRVFRWSLVAAYFALMLVMERPPYYVIQRFELVGGSTGWYRSMLIDAAISHIGEWWIVGTDYTRHWWFQNAVSANHIDITNHYLALGIMGGLPLMLLHIAILATAFSFAGRGFHDASADRRSRAMYWALGCALLTHAMTNISVSYFDQSFLFLYSTIAGIGSAHAVRAAKTLTAPLTVTRVDVKALSIAPRGTA